MFCSSQILINVLLRPKVQTTLTILTRLLKPPFCTEIDRYDSRGDQFIDKMNSVDFWDFYEIMQK